eukprot:362355-Chlamydomonas_euryale.AAC.11
MAAAMMIFPYKPPKHMQGSRIRRLCRYMRTICAIPATERGSAWWRRGFFRRGCQTRQSCDPHTFVSPPVPLTPCPPVEPATAMQEAQPARRRAAPIGCRRAMDDWSRN